MRTEAGMEAERAAIRADVLEGDAIEVLRGMESGSVDCCVTSPPYWGLRDYGMVGQLGLETTPQEYVSKLVAVFEEVRRVLREDGTLWLNLGDSYAANRTHQAIDNKHRDVGNNGSMSVPPGLKPKDLVGIPWRVAFALQADGWWLRAEEVWCKVNPMPESVRDRPTRAHEQVFLLAKSERYYYDYEAVKEEGVSGDIRSPNRSTEKGIVGPGGWKKQDGHGRRHAGFNGRDDAYREGAARNRRTWRALPSQPFPEAHFATFPEALVEPYILAGCRPGGVVLDPFCGSGTTLAVAVRLGRNGVGIELNPAYAAELGVGVGGGVRG